MHGRADLSRRRASGLSPRHQPGSTSPRAFRPRSPSAPSPWRSTARLADLADPIERDAKIEFLTREDPRALELIRHDAAHVLAEAVQIAVARHAGHHRPGDRERLLLRLLPQPAVHAGGLRRDREEDARDHRARQTLHQGGLVARRGQASLPRQGRELQGRAGRRHPGRPAAQDLQAGRLVRSLPRPAHDLDRQGRQRLQADEGRRRLLARRFNNPMLTRIYGTAFAKQEELDAYLKQIEEAEKRDHRRLGREMDLFHFQEEAPGSVFWHPKGWTLFQPLENYIRRRQTEAGYAEVNSPQLMDSSLWVASGHMATFRESMFLTAAARGGRAHLRHQADELPGPHPDLQERAQIVPRPAVQARRVRQGAPLRAVGRAARADARARLHPGRRARLHHRGADRRRSRSRSTI